MKKIKMGICEKIEFQHDFEIELPENVDEEQVYREIDRTDHRDAVWYIIEKYGGKVLEFTEDGSGEVNLEVEWVE